MRGHQGAARLLGAVLSVLALPAAAQVLAVDALGDLRLIRPSAERSWTEGGAGRLRFGAGGGQDLDLRVDQLLADVSLRLGSDVLAFATVRHEATQQSALDLVEAYARLRHRPDDTAEWSLKLGAFFPPVSIENDGIGWTSPWTITPSAINTWVGEELKTIGAEAAAEWRIAGGAVGLTGAVFGVNDSAGLLLAARGWSFGDRPTGLFDNLRLPDDVALRQRRSTPHFVAELLEIDDRPGFYGGASWRADGIGRLAVLWYDNRGDVATRRFGQAAWRTEFAAVSVESYLQDFVLFGQAMAGETEVAPNPAARAVTRFQSAYVLAARIFGDWNAALRLDVFATQQPYGPNPDASERGHALTLAATWSPVRRLRLTGEALRIDGRRAQRAQAGLSPDPTETQLLLNLRLLY